MKGDQMNEISSTIGADLHEIKLNEFFGWNSINFTIIDFAGQPEYHTIHQVF